MYIWLQWHSGYSTVTLLPGPEGVTVGGDICRMNYKGLCQLFGWLTMIIHVRVTAEWMFIKIAHVRITAVQPSITREIQELKLETTNPYDKFYKHLSNSLKWSPCTWLSSSCLPRSNEHAHFYMQNLVRNWSWSMILKMIWSFCKFWSFSGKDQDQINDLDLWSRSLKKWSCPSMAGMGQHR